MPEWYENWKQKIWTFCRRVENRNHDFPYHDYIYLNNAEGQETLSGCYVVGTSNKDSHGDQHKLFVSKHTLIYPDDTGCTVRLNDSENVDIAAILGWLSTSDWLQTNIHAVFYTIPAGNGLKMYFEGVLPEEARNPE